MPESGGGYNAINPWAKPADDVGHGTAMAGVVAGAGVGKIGAVGVNWGNVRALSGAGPAAAAACCRRGTSGYFWLAGRP